MECAICGKPATETLRNGKPVCEKHLKLVRAIAAAYPTEDQIDALAAKVGARWDGTNYVSIESEPPLQDHEFASWDGDPGYF